MRNEKAVIFALCVGKLRHIEPNLHNLVGVMPKSSQDYKYLLRFTPKNAYNVDRIFGLDTVVASPTGDVVGRFQSVFCSH